MPSSAKRKVPTGEVSCCRRLSVFAAVCGVVSLLVHTYKYARCESVDERLSLEGRAVEALRATLEERIDAYVLELSASHRLKREAMLVWPNVYSYSVFDSLNKLFVILRAELELFR